MTMSISTLDAIVEWQCGPSISQLYLRFFCVHRTNIFSSFLSRVKDDIEIAGLLEEDVVFPAEIHCIDL